MVPCGLDATDGAANRSGGSGGVSSYTERREGGGRLQPLNIPFESIQSVLESLIGLINKIFANLMKRPSCSYLVVIEQRFRSQVITHIKVPQYVLLSGILVSKRLMR